MRSTGTLCEVAGDGRELLALERDVDQAAHGATRPDAARVPRALRLDDAAQVAARRLVERRRGQRVAEAEHGRAPFLGVGEEIELRVLDELGEPGDGLVDAARAP